MVPYSRRRWCSPRCHRHAKRRQQCALPPAPAVTPLIAAARALGCGTVTGADMFARVRDLMVEFLLEA